VIGLRDIAANVSIHCRSRSLMEIQPSLKPDISTLRLQPSGSEAQLSDMLRGPAIALTSLAPAVPAALP
jgi:hypothetical protein